MGLAINGDVVHGLAVGGQSFQPVTRNSDGSITFEGQNYAKGASDGYIPSLLGKKVSIPHYATVYYYDADIEDYDSENTSHAGHPIIDTFYRSSNSISSMTGNAFVLEIIGEKVIDGSLYVAFAGEEDGKDISWTLYDDIKSYI